MKIVVGIFKEKAARISANINVQHALVGYACHLTRNPNDYEGATKEAAYDLDDCDVDQFKLALKEFLNA